MANQRILLLGGTFDPIHNAHLAIARSVAEHLAVEKTILIPSANPPHKMNHVITDAKDRLHMCQLATQDETLFEVSDCELNRPGPSYTIDTLHHFRNLYGPDAKLYWLIGTDSIADLPSWYRIQEITNACTLIAARRPGSQSPDFTSLKSVLTTEEIEILKTHCLKTPLYDISATQIRQRIQQGKSITDLTPGPVEIFIKKNKLYTS